MTKKNTRLHRPNFIKVESSLRKLKSSLGSISIRTLGSGDKSESKDLARLLEAVEELTKIIKEQSKEIDNLYKILDRHESGLG